MFYSYDLLSIRQKGKLAQCWLAATVNEQIFKQMYKSSSVNKINLYDLCKEIINTIQIKSNESTRRFSLYLSSQLMYGAVKILSYQTINLQNHVFQISRKVLYYRRDKTYEIRNISTDFELCNATSLIKDYSVVQLGSVPNLQDKFTINNKMEIMMHDATCLDFGALTHEQLNFLHTNDENLTLEACDRIDNTNQNLDKNLSNVCCDNEMVFTQSETSVLSMVQNKIKISISPIHDDVALRHEEHQITFVKSILPEITMEEIESRVAGWQTPQKRQPNEERHTETPSKRRRLRFDEAADENQDVTVPLPETEALTVSATDHPLELLQDLQSVDEDSQQIKRKSSKKRAFADENTKLSYRTIRKWLNNIKAHTVLLNIIDVNISKPEVLFKTPSTSRNPMDKTKWNHSLNTLFHIHTAGFSRKKAVQRKYDHLLEKSTEFTRFENKSNKTEELLSELSSALGKSVVSSKNVTSEKNMTITMDEFPEVLKVHDMMELITDASAVIQSPEISGSTLVPETNYISKTLSSCLLTKREFFVLLEIAWQNTDFAAFNDVITPGHYSKLDAACCFTYLLEFHKEKRIILKQMSPYDIIWVQKCA